MPCDLFDGTDESPPSKRMFNTLSSLLQGMTRLVELTLPNAEHTPTRKLLSLVPSLRILRFSHVQPTPAHIDLIAEACPNLTELWFTMYWFPVRADTVYSSESLS